jgi:hypothetical protein
MDNWLHEAGETPDTERLGYGRSARPDVYGLQRRDPKYHTATSWEGTCSGSAQ